MKTHDEQQLLKGCINKDRTAQNALFKKYSGQMLAICFRYCSSYDQARDALQIGFIRVFQNIKYYNGKGSLYDWIRGIMVHSAIDEYNQQKKKCTVDLEEAIELPDLNDGAFENRDLIKLLNRLPHEHRRIINLYAVEGRTHAEIGTILGVAESSSRRKLTEARVLLKQFLNKDLKTYENERH